MDNEEIKKLLQELKESSDESSSVRSKVVKIHMDTPAEAQKREREKRKAEEREARKRQEEEEKARAEEEARRLEAEKAAQEVVEEAKKEAKAGFASDLDMDLIKSGSSFPEGEETGEDADDLDLNWDYEKPELKSGFAKEEDFDLGPKGDKTSSEDASGAEGEGDPDMDEDFESDEDEFRSEKDGESESISGLPGLFGAISDKVLAFAGGIHKSVKEDLSKAKNTKNEDAGEEDDPEGEADDSQEQTQTAVGDDSKEMHELPSYWDDEEPEGNPKDGSAEHTETANKEPDAESSDHDGVDMPAEDASEEEDAVSKRVDAKERRRQRNARGRKSRTKGKESDAEQSAPAREYGPDEEWKRRLEEPPKKKSFFQKFRSEMARRSEAGPDKTTRREKKEKHRNRRKEADQEQVNVQQDEMPVDEEMTEDAPAAEAVSEMALDETVSDETAEAQDLQDEAAMQDTAMQETSRIEEARESVDANTPDPAIEDVTQDDQGQEAVLPEDTAPESVQEEDLDADAPEEEPAREDIPSSGRKEESRARKESRAAMRRLLKGAPKPAAKEEAAGSKRIEVINLNENQNNKDASIIPLTGDTGPLPDPAVLEKESGRFGGLKGKFAGFGKGKKTEDELSDAQPKVKKEKVKKEKVKKEKVKKEKVRPENSDNEKDSQPSALKVFFETHRKQLLIGALVLLAVILLVVVVTLVIKNMPQTRKESIEADEGLTVRVVEQPEEYVKAGDVKISVNAPETIQSITVNGENVVVDQGRSVDFTYHATGGTLDLMAVSTDKVRNAKVILAYVDSAPPVVTLKEVDGKIEISAEDTESGLEGIYVGTFDGLSQIPQYEKYSEPLEADPDKQIMYYAKDVAGNSSVPTLVALTPAKSIELSQERYTLFPGSTVKVELITTPENAFVNNLSLEAENTKVVQIEGGFQLKGLAEGDTKITATADGISGVMADVSVSNERTVTVSAVGDCTLGTDISFSQNNSLPAYEALYGPGYFFEKVKGILSSDDTTFANFEGTLTTSDAREADKIFAFKGDPSYTQILLDGSIDAVTLANNHRDDYGEDGRKDTEKALEDAGIEWCYGDKVAYRELNGVLTAYIGIRAVENQLDTLPQVKSTIAEAKKKGAELIIIEFHWGAELVAEVDEYQKELAHAAVDAGANLVLGSHAHVLQGIEKYNGVYIVYGLANFCFGGSTNPTSYDSMIWRQTFTFTADGLASEDDIEIIPCQTSGDLTINNYQPVPVSGDAAKAIMDTIDNLSAPFGQSYSQYMVDGTMWTEQSEG